MTASTLTIIFTGIIAVATTAYFIATIFLWRSANETAQAAKQSTDLLVSLHRPYIGVTRFAPTDINANPWWITWEIKNFGTLPAPDVVVDVTLFVNDTPLRSLPPSPPLEVFSSASVSDSFEIHIDANRRNSLVRGDTRLSARIQVHYPAPGHGRYRHTVMAVYYNDRQNFRLENSHTERVGD